VKANQATQPVQAMCRLLNVSASGYYAWDVRSLCDRARRDIALTAKIQSIHGPSHGAYGAPMIHAELADDHGIRIGRKRVARLMRAANLQRVWPHRFVITTFSAPGAKPALDLVDRAFYAEAPDRLWVADVTYIPTWTGFLYLAAVLDVYSRKIVGWAMKSHLRTELVLAAIDMAIAQRRAVGVIHHSDHGCQYTSYAFGKRYCEAGVKPSMGSVGDCYDNAMAESLWATLEREVLSRRRFRSQAEARMAVFTWIEAWYNPVSYCPPRYVIDRFRKPCLSAGISVPRLCARARSTSSATALESKVFLLKIQGPSANGCSALNSPRSTASRRVLGLTPISAAVCVSVIHPSFAQLSIE
jgi:putative transposase